MTWSGPACFSFISEVSLKEQFQNPVCESDIAIIAMCGRFPGARSIEQFWENLAAGKESIVHFTEEELRAHGVTAEVLNHPATVRAAALVEDIDMFDAPFFGYSPREAAAIDPQQRIFLECVSEVLERAGYDPDRCKAPIGVYAGTNISTYLMNILSSQTPDISTQLAIALGNDKDYLTTRVSYKLNLRGPSMCVQTACSTALAAVHLACISLLEYDCDMAVAGGVSIRTPQPEYYQYQEGSILSPDGHCRSFDAAASGTVFGNGAGVVLLKRLADALEDGDQILAVIKGSAANNDGSAKVGYTAPSLDGQVEVIRAALARADVTPSAITYVETHSIGTPLGDAMEVAALAQVFREYTERDSFCGIGCVKTNLGHLGAAAGIAGLLKTVLCLQHGYLAPSLHFNSPNPGINFADSPFFVSTKFAEWQVDFPRRAAVNSIGIGGTNVHLILEEAPKRKAPSGRSGTELLTLSARTGSSLERMAQDLRDHLECCAPCSISDVAYTTRVGRRVFPFRKAIICSGSTAPFSLDAPGMLTFTNEASGSPPGCVFLFSDGIGAPRTGLELYRNVREFRQTVDDSIARLDPPWAVELQRTFSGALQEGAIHSADTGALFDRLNSLVIEYALAQTLISMGVTPIAMMGSGAGEYAAACVAGVFTLRDCVQFLFERERSASRQAMGASLHEPKIPMVSGDSGTWMTRREATDHNYWMGRLNSHAHGKAEIRKLITGEKTIFVRIGAGDAFADKNGGTIENADVIPTLGSGLSGTPDDEESRVFLACLGRLWVNGVAVELGVLNDGEDRRRVLLPTYPFERRRYWLGPDQMGSTARRGLDGEGVKDEASGPKSSDIRHPRPLPPQTYVRPQTPNQMTVAKIWEELLGVESVGIHDDFIELGGHSLLGIELASRLGRSFQTEISLQAIFEYRTIAGLVDWMESGPMASNGDAQTERLLEEIERLSPAETHAKISDYRSARPSVASVLRDS